MKSSSQVHVILQTICCWILCSHMPACRPWHCGRRRARSSLELCRNKTISTLLWPGFQHWALQALEQTLRKNASRQSSASHFICSVAERALTVNWASWALRQRPSLCHWEKWENWERNATFISDRWKARCEWPGWSVMKPAECEWMLWTGWVSGGSRQTRARPVLKYQEATCVFCPVVFTFVDFDFILSLVRSLPSLNLWLLGKFAYYIHCKVVKRQESQETVSSELHKRKKNLSTSTFKAH